MGKLTIEDVGRMVDEGMTAAEIAKRYGRDLSNVAKQVRWHKAQNAPLSEPLAGGRIDRATQGYVVTAAQNNTSVHRKFLRTLEHYCKLHRYQLIVIPMRYRNPTSPKEAGKSEDGEWWASEVRPYLFGEDSDLAPNLRLMGSIRISPTAIRPLSSLEAFGGESSTIYGHTKVALESTPTRAASMAKLMYTTGCVTRPNYSDSKAGRKGEFHHVYGAVVVQKDGDLFHLRHIHGQENGAFYDLDCKYGGDSVTDGHRLTSLVPGDIHAEMVSQDAMGAYNRVCDRLRPKRVIGHDVLNFGSASHHNTFFEKFKRHQTGTDCVYSEIETTCAVMDELASRTDRLHIIASNHNDHFTKWLECEKNANDVRNAWVYAQTRAYYLGEIMEGREPMSPLEYWAAQLCQHYRRMTFIGRNEGLMLGGVEHAYHGDKGPNGARGSTRNLSRIGAKVSKGHSHDVAIIDGAYSAGTFSILDPEYTHGAPSSWINSMVAMYPNGKRTHIHVIKGRCGV